MPDTKRKKQYAVAFRVFRAMEKVTIAVAAAVVGFWAITPWRVWLTKHGIVDDATIAAIIAFLLVLVFKTLASLDERLSTLSGNPEDRDALIIGGVRNVYLLIERLVAQRQSQITPGRRKRIRFDVIGLTLDTVWPYLEGRLGDTSMKTLHIRLLCLDPDFIKTAPIFEISWAAEAQNNIERIAAYASEERESLDQRDISLELYTYGELPPFHGFAIDSDNVVMAMCHWSKADRMARTYDVYEHFTNSDRSTRSQHYERVFANWQSHLMKSAHLQVSVGTSTEHRGINEVSMGA
jgi:hypothetical protein